MPDERGLSPSEQSLVAEARRRMEESDKQVELLFEAWSKSRSKPRQRFARWVYRRLGGLP